jgi:hypothetical protein
VQAWKCLTSNHTWTERPAGSILPSSASVTAANNHDKHDKQTQQNMNQLSTIRGPATEM